MSKKDRLILVLHNASKTETDEVILDFLDRYNLYRLMDATTEQLEEYAERLVQN